MVDALVPVSVYAVKVFRVMVMWLAVYVMEKVYLQRYMSRVYLSDDARPRPPSLVAFGLWCVLLEAVAFGYLWYTLYAMYALYKSDDNGFVIDWQLLRALLLDYAYTTALFAVSAVVVALVVQNCRLFRYRHDGARGVRALSVSTLIVFAVLQLAPFYRL